MSSITVRIDDETKREATRIIEALGLDVSSVTRAFFRQIVRDHRIPLSFTYEEPNEESLQSLREAKQLTEEYPHGRFDTAEELFRSLEN